MVFIILIQGGMNILPIHFVILDSHLAMLILTFGWRIVGHTMSTFAFMLTILVLPLETLKNVSMIWSTIVDISSRVLDWWSIISVRTSTTITTELSALTPSHTFRVCSAPTKQSLGSNQRKALPPLTIAMTILKWIPLMSCLSWISSILTDRRAPVGHQSLSFWYSMCYHDPWTCLRRAAYRTYDACSAHLWLITQETWRCHSFPNWYSWYDNPCWTTASKLGICLR